MVLHHKTLLRKFSPLIVVVLSAIPYIAGLNGEFVFDDIFLIRDDPFYHSAAASFSDCWNRGFWHQHQEQTQGLYRPLTIFSYLITAKTAGLYSPAFRLVNLIFHLLVTYLVFKVALKLRFDFFTAFFAAILFGIHPIHTEAVIPAFGRAEQLCAFFILSGLIFHIYSGRFPIAGAVVVFCQVFAFWSKEHGIILLPLCLIYDWYSRKIPEIKSSNSNLRDFIIKYAFYLSAIAVVFFARIAVTGSFLPTLKNFDIFMDNQLAVCPWYVRILNAVALQGAALVKFFWPRTLSHDYSYAQIIPVQTFMSTGFWLTIIGCLAIPIIIYIFKPSLKRKIIFLCLAYFVSILPASNILIPTGTIFAERLFYFPSIWLCLLTVMVLNLCFKKTSPRFAIIIIVIILVVVSFRTAIRSFDWQSQMNIVQAGIRTAPYSIKTWHNLAVELADMREYDEAIAACSKALAIYPDSKKTLGIRADYYIKTGNFKAAESDLRRILSLGTKNPETYNKLGAILAEKGDFFEAEKLWKTSLNLLEDQKAIKEALNTLESDIKNSNRKTP